MSVKEMHKQPNELDEDEEKTNLARLHLKCLARARALQLIFPSRPLSQNGLTSPKSSSLIELRANSPPSNDPVPLHWPVPAWLPMRLPVRHPTSVYLSSLLIETLDASTLLPRHIQLNGCHQDSRMPCVWDRLECIDVAYNKPRDIDRTQIFKLWASQYLHVVCDACALCLLDEAKSTARHSYKSPRLPVI
ncbi:hypothetical protein BDQ12DRAFT_725036 [Crucibulum laeve]|uniref:Uncharacterized protein n=1 Tax=Crucibulum laeve TaxID=68775 RepID=A0A5C3LVH6_9AGAR|nr:hypothetical protein BDQ12DRAFT_725036 [Crucibulum laeve]